MLTSMSFTWGKRFPEKTMMNGVIWKIFTGTILDVTENLSNIGIFLCPESVACLLDQLVNPGAVSWPLWHVLFFKLVKRSLERSVLQSS